MEINQPIFPRINPCKSIRNRALRPDWLGQTAASLCWIVSMFVYGIDSVGDWLQLMAASAWLLANLWTLVGND